MSGKDVPITEAIQFGWNTLRENFVFFLKLMLLLIAIGMLPAFLVQQLIVAVGPALGFPLQFLLFVWQLILSMGLLKICLKLYDHEAVQLSDLWSCISHALDYLVANFLYTVIFLAGLALLIVPGLIWGVQFLFSGYLVVDKGARVMQALKGSSLITRGAKWGLAAFVLVIIAMNLVGLLFLGVGIFITLPISALAGVYAYRKLLEQSGGQWLAES
jgi:uncharacterized membrane protein